MKNITEDMRRMGDKRKRDLSTVNTGSCNANCHIEIFATGCSEQL